MPERNKTSTINVRLKEKKSEYSFCFLCFYSEIISQQGSFFSQAVCYEWFSYKYFNAVVDKS